MITDLLLASLLQGGDPGAAAPAGPNPLGTMLIYIVGFGAIFYFFLIRPQRQESKRHQALVNQLKRGDQVITAGGLIGEVIHLKDDRVTIKTGESRVVVARSKITQVMTAETTPQPATEKEKAKS